MENYIKTESMNFKDAVRSVLNNMLNFNGRARRSELWWFFLPYAIVSFLCNLILSPWPLVNIIVALILIMILSSVTVRRLHDRGHSGWWVAVSIIVSTFSQFYFYFKGFFDIMDTVNPDPEAAFRIIFDPTVMICSTVSMVVNIAILVFCILDGKPETNKYGRSPKYIDLNEDKAL